MRLDVLRLGILGLAVLRLAILAPVLAAALGAPAARAVEAVNVPNNGVPIDLTGAMEYRHTDGGRVLVSTAPGPDGIVRRIEVRGREAGTNWAVFALANNGDQQLDRLIVAPHYRMVGSGLLWPDLGYSRIVQITPSSGDPPELQKNPATDIYRITLDPGTVITFVAELRTPKLPQLYLWEPDAYKDKINALTLYQGIVIGIAGLLALFLTILFVVKGSVMFPAAAALGWAVLIYVGIDFGFWGKVLDLTAAGERAWRAAGEAILAATLLVFLFAYLNLNRWHVRYGHITAGWLAFLGALVAVALFSPDVASGVARICLFLIAVLGLGLVVYLSTHRYDRAVMLIPTWLLLVVWTIGAALTVLGYITNDIVSPALLGGLVLIVMLIGFTVMQHAFAGGMAHGVVADVERRALALTAAGDMIWDWDVAADHVFTSPHAEDALALKHGTLQGPAGKWLEVLHRHDRDRFRTALDGAIEMRRGRVDEDVRVRTADDHYLWFRLRARPVVGSDGEVVRLVGTLCDVTAFKTTEERLLHDALHDNLTGLPNRDLFLDRLQAALGFAGKGAGAPRAAVMVIDLDRLRRVDEAAGMASADSILLTLARRLDRLVEPQDTLARLAGDRLGLLLVSEREAGRVVAFAETVRRTLAAPIAFNDRELVLSAAIGVVLGEGEVRGGKDMLADAELAMYHAKRSGGDRVAVFTPAMRAGTLERRINEASLRRAIEGNEIDILYRPIVRLDSRAVAGFEARARWSHPKLGPLSPRELRALAEDNGLAGALELSVLERVARQLGAWQRTLRQRQGLFCCVDVCSRQLLRPDLIADLRNALAPVQLARGSLKLAFDEAAVMDNPEQVAQMLQAIRELGAGLALGDFGAGYCSLAYLPRFPFDTVRIDRSFVRAAAKGTRPPLLPALIALAHDLGMDVLAEGGEADAAELQRLGCEFVQGAAFGEPMAAERARALLQPARKAPVSPQKSVVG